MINCNKCKSNISRNMKHSLKSNECPFCGNYLLSNQDLKACKDISYDLLNAGFKESEIYDMSIFIYNTYIKESFLSSAENNEPNNNTSAVFEEESIDDAQSKELLEEDTSSLASIPDNEDEDDRVARLRELARSNPILNKKGVSVRRVAD